MVVYITPEGYAALVAEYEFLMKKERPRITAEVRYAASLGDRSENAEYQYGKQRLREIDRRLHYLQGRLDKIMVVDPSEFSPPTVRFGATVVIADEEGVEQTLTIKGEDELDLEQGFISYMSPVGRALIGKDPGDEVTVKIPGGTRVIELLSVRYPAPD
jgi:transcription elongation factor GreB